MCTGRSSRDPGGPRSDYNRPETIEETAELVTSLGGGRDRGRRRSGSSTSTKVSGSHHLLPLLIDKPGGLYYDLAKWP